MYQLQVFWKERQPQVLDSDSLSNCVLEKSRRNILDFTNNNFHSVLPCVETFAYSPEIKPFKGSHSVT